MSTPLEFFNYENNHLFSENVKLSTIVKDLGTPTYIYSTQGFLDPLREFQLGLNRLEALVCFALKSNSNSAILSLLGKAGAGMDVVTGGELERAKRAHVPAERIVFSGVGKSRREMTEALEISKEGIFSFNVESIAELRALNQTALNLGKKANIALRFNPDVNPKTHPYISTGLNENKFGMEKEEILNIAENINNFQGIELRGLSIHIGSQLTTLAPLSAAFARLAQLIKEVNLRLTLPLSFIDLGGGLGITYKNEKVPTIKQYCDLIYDHFGKVHPFKEMKILIEPGRTLSGNAGILVTQILYRKKRKNKEFLIIDAGMNDLIRPALYQSYHQIVPLKISDNKNKKFDVVGPVCESADCFASNRSLPAALQEGDFLAILSAGAYGFAMSNNYNSRPRPAEVLVDRNTYRIIRNRETYDDLFHREQI